MARRPKSERVLGPYRDRTGWRILIAETPDQKRRLYFTTEREAVRAKRLAEQEFAEVSSVTIGEAVDAYELHQRDVKQDKLRSVADTVYRIGLLCPDRQALVSSLTPQRCEALLRDLRQRPTKFDRPFAVDSLKNVLAETKTFANWCVSKKWLRANPFGGLRIEGKRRHRKPQLRLDEARRWTERAMTLAESGDVGAVAAMVTLTMGLRASEVVKRTVRDLDSDGTVLVVEDAKTEAGNRRVRVPVAMQPFLKRLANGRPPEARLFGNHWRDWVRKAVARICKDAGVPVVCAHSMRGLHSTLAMELGMSPEVVAKTLGHESARTTLTSYAAPDAVSVGLQRRATANLLKNTKRRPARRNIVPVSFRNDLFAVRRGS